MEIDGRWIFTIADSKSYIEFALTYAISKIWKMYPSVKQNVNWMVKTLYGVKSATWSIKKVSKFPAVSICRQFCTFVLHVSFQRTRSTVPATSILFWGIRFGVADIPPTSQMRGPALKLCSDKGQNQSPSEPPHTYHSLPNFADAPFSLNQRVKKECNDDIMRGDVKWCSQSNITSDRNKTSLY